MVTESIEKLSQFGCQSMTKLFFNGLSRGNGMHEPCAHLRGMCLMKSVRLVEVQGKKTITVAFIGIKHRGL